MESDRAEAKRLIEQANDLLRRGRVDGAVELYRGAIELCPEYGSFHLVIGDALYDSGRRAEAADAYRDAVGVVPDHDQAWESLAIVLYELGREREATRALARHYELQAGLTKADVTDLVQGYTAAADINARSCVVNRLIHSLDDRVTPILHDFLLRAAQDLRWGRRGSGNPYWAALANTLVRFGMAEFVWWYANGPGPDPGAIADDVRRYVETHRTPPPLADQRAVREFPPPARHAPSD